MIFNCSAQVSDCNNQEYNSIGFNAFDTYTYGISLITRRDTILIVVPLKLFNEYTAVIYAVSRVFYCKTSCC